MNQRERILAGAIMALVALWGGRSLFIKYRTAVDARRAQVQDAQAKLADANLTLAKGRSAVQQMESLQKRSLPTDRERALSLYKAWLLTKAKAAGLTVNDIKLAPRTTASTAFDAIGYQIEANGTLPTVISMLYEFYHSPQLQQITRLRLQRPPGATQLQVTLEVEALCLSGAIATDALPEGDSKRLKLASAADYQKSIGERDLATVYTPPRPPAPPGEKRDTPAAPPKFDEAQLAKFTGSVEGVKGREAWIRVFTTGEMLHVVAGDPVKIGTVEGQIESIDRLSLVLKIGDKKFLVSLGQSLLGGKEIDADGKVKPDAATESPKGET
jgi:hypothetical protein